jgi:hypothetical protein
MGLKRYVDAIHVVIAKKIEEKKIVQWKGIERQPKKKKDLMCLIVKYHHFFGVKDPFKKNDVQ